MQKLEFPKTHGQEWLRAASFEINGDDPLRKLSWAANDGLTFLPLYTENDVKDLTYRAKFDFQPSSGLYSEPRAWNNLPNVTVVDETAANKTALNHLANGADGILFDLHRPDINFTKLLDKIDWPYCSIAFELPAQGIATTIAEFKEYVVTKNYTSKLISGIFFWKKLSIDAEFIVKQLEDQKKINCLGLVIQAMSPVQEISQALIEAVNLIDELTGKGIEPEMVIKNIAFSVPVGINFLLEISKIKALRMLWFQVSQAYGVTNYIFSDLHIHARSEAWVNEKYEPHSNILKGTLSSIAAVMGGCNSLTVYPEDENTIMVNRIFRNVSNILREESHFGKVADPTAGSYALENMTTEIARKAWLIFLSHVKQSTVS